MTAIDTFNRVSKFNLSNYFSRFKTFIDSYYQNIIGYYEGNNELNQLAVNELDALLNLSQNIEESFELNKNKFSENTGFWDLYEDFIDTKIKLETVRATPKWLRSSYINDYDRDTKVNYITKQNQTLEQVVEEFQYINSEDWLPLAVNNKISETDYTTEGGAVLSISFRNNSRVNTNQVVDIMIDNNVIGKDLSIEKEFIDNDVKTLTPQETLLQAVNILFNVYKGSVPEFPDDGLNKGLVGSNRNNIQYPIIFRQLQELFRKDDSFTGLDLLGFEFVQDSVQFKFRITTKQIVTRREDDDGTFLINENGEFIIDWDGTKIYTQ